MDHPGNMTMGERMATLAASNLEHARRNPNEILNLCPFRCKVQNLNSEGYCRHLVGWTIDMETVELREVFGTGFERTGNLIGSVEEDDVLVSGTPFRTDKNKNLTPTPTHRVYRKNGKAPVKDDGTFRKRTQGKEVSFDPEEEDEEEEALAAV